MSEWPEIKIDDLKAPTKGSIAMGPFGSRIKAENFVSKGIPVIKGGNLNGDFILENSFSFLTKEKADELSSANAFRRDIVITHRGTIGQVGIIPDNSKYERYIVSQSQLKVSLDKTKTNPFFIYYFLRSPLGQNRLLQNASQVGVPAIAQASTSVKARVVPHPEKPIQDKIVDVLLNLDHKIANNRRINETLEEMAQAIFKSWFVDFDPVRAKVEMLESGGSNDDARLAAMRAISGKSPEDLQALKTEEPDSYTELASTADAFPSSFTTSTLGDIPEGWEVKTIGDCYKVVMGQSPSGETYNEKENGTLFYQGRAEFGWRFPTPRLYTTDPKRMADAGDVLISVRAPVGDMNIAISDCCVGRGLGALRHESGSTTFSYYQLNSIKSELDRFNGEGTVFGSINQKDLKNISVISPSDAILKKFIQKCSAFDEIILSSSLEIISLAETRDALLPKLLSGEIDVSALSDTEAA